MDLRVEFNILESKGLTINFFARDRAVLRNIRSLRSSIHDPPHAPSPELKDKLFVVVTNPNGDPRQYTVKSPYSWAKRVGTWIDCEASSTSDAQWKIVTDRRYDLRVYFFGRHFGIDFKEVHHDVFQDDGDGGGPYTYTFKDQRTHKVYKPVTTIPALGRYCERFWENAKSFTDLIDLNRRFLRGELPQTPGHFGPVDSETEPLIESLLKLHEFGLLTTNSQPWQNHRDQDCWWRQRPYLEFVMSAPIAQVSRFIKNLKAQKLYIHACQMYPYRTLPESTEKEVVVTKWRDIPQKTKAWKISTCIRADNTQEEDFYQLPAMMNTKIVMVIIVTSSCWDNSQDLLGLIADAAKQCKLRPGPESHEHESHEDQDEDAVEEEQRVQTALSDLQIEN